MGAEDALKHNISSLYTFKSTVIVDPIKLKLFKLHTFLAEIIVK